MTRYRHQRHLAAALLATLTTSAQAGDMYRCTDGGQTTYSDKPCSGSAQKITVQPPPASSATTRAPRPGQPPNRYLPEADAVQVPAGLQCDKPVDGPSMQQLAKAYARFEEIRSAAAAVPRVGIGGMLLELMRARDAVTDVPAQSPCARAIKAAAAKRAELSYLALKTFAAGDNIEHLHMETAASHAGIHYVKGRQMYGF